MILMETMGEAEFGLPIFLAVMVRCLNQPKGPKVDRSSLAFGGAKLRNVVCHINCWKGHSDFCQRKRVAKNIEKNVDHPG